MKVLIDTCVLVDYLQNRLPFADDAEKILSMAVNDCFESFFTAKAVTDVNYILNKYKKYREEALLFTGHLWQLCSILDTTASDAFNALFSTMTDYEDALMVETALSNDIDIIITRNKKDYLTDKIKIYTPAEFLTGQNKKRIQND